ncbi:thymidine phosphorylase [bacterium]|nr:thymidine phosphorylase [bacterium]
MNPVELIIKKRDGIELSREEMSLFVKAYIDGKIPDYQMSALLMAIFFQGMETDEIVSLTDVYINSGAKVTFPQEMNTVDKHSTGGVGDKITLMLAPLVASLGVKVPMISGRGLGHTGGTLDKLESIPNFRTDFNSSEFKKMVNESNLCIIQQSKELVPADKIIYAMRDVSGTVESYPLITASIMSKKIAEGAQNLAVDLKVGSGAFMKNLDNARELAKYLKLTGEAFGQKVAITFTNMNSPLGHAIGNAIEIKETIEYLKGANLPDIDAITKALAVNMVLMSKGASTKEEALAMIEDSLSSGKALDYFRKFIEMQGGDSRIIDDYDLLPHTRKITEIKSKRSGFVQAIDSKSIGYALVGIGAGRKKLEDQLNYATGAELFKKVGDEVQAGEVIGYLHCDDDSLIDLTIKRIIESYLISTDKIEKEEIILDQWEI